MPRRSGPILAVAMSAWAGCGPGANGSAQVDGGPSNAGAVAVTQRLDSARGTIVVVVGALFEANLDTSFCQRRTQDGCLLTVCPKVPPAGTPEPRLVGADRITVTGGATTIELLPDASGLYRKTQDGPLWQPGDTISMSADGATVPAFSGSAVAPSDVQITSPAPAGGALTVTIPRDVDLAVGWTGGTTGQVSLALAPKDAPSTIRLSCAFPASAGQGTISKAALAMLPAGDALLSASVFASQDVSRSGWTLTYTLNGIATSPVPILEFPLAAKLE